MKKDELITMWKEGHDQMFREKQIDKAMIEKYLNEKTLKGSKSIRFNIVFYWFIQVAGLILISMNLSGYLSNPTMIWILVPQLVVTIGIMIFGMDLFYKLREINNYSESLLNLINLQLRFFKGPYEVWLVLASVSAIILITNVNLYIDNNNGTYLINNKALFAGVNIAAFLFIYGTQKLASLRSFRSLKMYLSDLRLGVLDQTVRMEGLKKRFIWLYVAIFILLSISLVFGILAALKYR
jgi:hypothetical protein